MTRSCCHFFFFAAAVATPTPPSFFCCFSFFFSSRFRSFSLRLCINFDAKNPVRETSQKLQSLLMFTDDEDGDEETNDHK